MRWNVSLKVRLFALLLMAVSIVSLTPARAADDASAAQQIIRSQVEALMKDDAATAYAFASPQIQEMFPGAERFMSMVRNGYPPIYRHRQFEFGASSIDNGKIMQRASIIDADDMAWEALYTVERQPDGSLKISACVLLKVGTAV